MPAKLKKNYQIKVKLMDIQPPIWRRLLVTSDIKLDSLHSVLQDAMGWFNCHLHQYEHAGALYGMASEQEDPFGLDERVESEGKYRLSDLLQQEKDSLIYEYDFGGGWRHEIQLEKILPLDKQAPSAICVEGERACPPEDCGGPWGYQSLLDTLADPSSEDYAEMREWVGEEFDPEEFNLVKTNRFIEQRHAMDPESMLQ